MFEKKKGKRKIMKVIVATNGVDNKPLLGELNWHERAAFQSVGVRAVHWQ